MRIAAPAKINIGLLVGGARSDGYHDIETIMACISLCDYINITVRPADHTAVRISGNESYLTHSSADDGCKGSTKRADLLERAAFAFSERTGLRFSADISIEKHIPVKAGLGGGSSDAGAVFTFLNKHFGLNLAFALQQVSCLFSHVVSVHLLDPQIMMLFKLKKTKI